MKQLLLKPMPKAGRKPRYRRGPSSDVRWAEIVVADPEKNRGLMLQIALMALHRAGRAHSHTDCPHCKESHAKANAAHGTSA